MGTEIFPDKNGYFGQFGGRFVPETLVFALDQLISAYGKTGRIPSFRKALSYHLKNYAGRPTPLYFAKNLTQHLKGPKIYLKREDLCHTGAHKINNTIGQALLAKEMGKKRIIAETGAGQHGVATAAASALFGLKCEIYMGEEDIKRQAINVYRMELLGADVIPVRTGSRTLKDAINECLRDWVTNVRDTYYLLGSVVGPHPYPVMVRNFQSVIGSETRGQVLRAEGRLPRRLVACVGGGSNSMGLFHPFFKDRGVKFVGVEAGGHGLNTGKHSATLCKGSVGVLHGTKTCVLQDREGQISPTHSVSAGLDYPGVGPEHSYYRKIKRAQYTAITDKEAIESFHLLSEIEGITPALEPSHAIAWVVKNAVSFRKTDTIVLCLSGRGDKDIDIVRKAKT